MSAILSPSAAGPPTTHASTVDILGDYWPGIQIYYPPVKYAPSLGIYEPKLSPERRREIARLAASKRWDQKRP